MIGGLVGVSMHHAMAVIDFKQACGPSFIDVCINSLRVFFVRFALATHVPG
jgi:hypothetical protein